MRTTLITVATDAGGLVTVAATVGSCFSLATGHVPEPILIGLVTAGLILLIIGLVSRFEEQSRRWTCQMEAQLQARRHYLRFAEPTSHRSTTVHESIN